MLKSMKCQKGLTLIEVIIALTILIIIAAAFVPLFSTTFANIFTYGSKDQAMSYASDQMEKLYADQPFSGPNDIKDILGESSHVEESDNLYQQGSEQFNYYIEDDFKPISGNPNIEGFKVTIVVFYQDGERHVELTSFVRGE